MSAFSNEGFDYVKFIDEGFESQSKYGKAAGDKYTPEELLRVDSLLRLTGNAPDTLEAMKEALDFRYKQDHRALRTPQRRKHRGSSLCSSSVLEKQ